MAIQNPLKWHSGVRLFAAVFFLLFPDFNICTADVPRSLDRSKALVSIQSVNAVGSTGDKTGVLKGPAVLFLNKDPARLMKYSRSGSGVIIDPRGIVVTNAHIVQDAAGISVKLSSGIRLEGRVVHLIPGSDLAFLSIKPPFPLAYVSLANSDGLVPGSQVYCSGHALNHKGSLFGGKISAIMKRSALRESRTELLQVRFGFHLYGGDSGSPILDQKGNLLGLVSGGRRSGDMATLAIASNVIREAYWNIPKY
jgi:S1-C subfamily serine protease